MNRRFIPLISVIFCLLCVFCPPTRVIGAEYDAPSSTPAAAKQVPDSPKPKTEKGVVVSSFAEISAEYIEFDEGNEVFSARDNVRLSSGSTSLAGNEIFYDIKKGYGVVKGSVSVKVENMGLKAEKMEYDSRKNTGDIYGVGGHAGDWFFSTGKLAKEKERFYMEDCKIGTCELNPPHYFFRISSGRVVPRERIDVSNPWMWLWGLPTPIYFPWYRYSLLDVRGCLIVIPGYTLANGLVLKMKYSYLLKKGMYGIAYVDSYERVGSPGKGAEFNYRSSDNISSGRFYVYNTERWLFDYSLNKYYYAGESMRVETNNVQKLSKTWIMRSNIRYNNDPSFNNVFNMGNWTTRDQDITSDIGFTRYDGKTKLDIYARELLSYNTPYARYDIANFQLPKISFSVPYLQTKGIPGTFGLDSYFERLFQGGSSTNTFFDSNITERFTLNPIVLSQNDSITPSVNSTQYWQSRYSVMTSSLYKINFNERVDYRHNFGITSYVNIYHEGQMKLKDSSLYYDYESPDYGIGINRLGLTYSWMPSGRLFVNIDKMVDLTRYRPGYAYRPFYPWILTSYFSFDVGKVAVNLNYSQYLLPQQFQYFTGSVAYNLDKYSFFTLDFYHASPQSVTLTTSFGFWMGRGWRISLSRETGVLSNDIYESQGKTISLYKTLHCWEVTTYFREVGKPGQSNYNYSIDVLFGLRIGRKAMEKIYDREQEMQYAPWRDPF